MILSLTSNPARLQTDCSGIDDCKYWNPTQEMKYFTCPTYSAVHSNNATVATSTCGFYACGDDIIIITNQYPMVACHNDTYIRLFDESWVQLAEQDNADGCRDESSCEATVSVFGSGSWPPSQPTIESSLIPSSHPSSLPNSFPFTTLPLPSSMPSSQPSSLPMIQSSSIVPSSTPSIRPSNQPSIIPLASPLAFPSSQPSTTPSINPTFSPTSHTSIEPTSNPSRCPISLPSMPPTFQPSCTPNSIPTLKPSCEPTCSPSNCPSSKPSIHPAVNSSSAPSYSPNTKPSTLPTIVTTTIQSRDTPNKSTFVLLLSVSLAIIGIVAIFMMVSFIYAPYPYFIFRVQYIVLVY